MSLFGPSPVDPEVLQPVYHLGAPNASPEQSTLLPPKQPNPTIIIYMLSNLYYF